MRARGRCAITGPVKQAGRLKSFYIILPPGDIQGTRMSWRIVSESLQVQYSSYHRLPELNRRNPYLEEAQSLLEMAWVGCTRPSVGGAISKPQCKQWGPCEYGNFSPFPDSPDPVEAGRGYPHIPTTHRVDKLIARVEHTYRYTSRSTLHGSRWLAKPVRS